MFPERSVTQLLQDFGAGDSQALSQLIPLVYQELHKLAGSYLRNERAGHTLQPTALVHEAYLRLASQQQPGYKNRSHFYGVAAQVMRQILVDHARSHNAVKRGGGAVMVSLDESWNYTEERASGLIALDDALTALAKENPQRARLVEMRYFGGLSTEEAAEAVGMNAQQVYREMRIAQAWLQREIDRTPAGPAE